MKNLLRTFAIFWLSLTHTLGLCKFLHKKDKGKWYSEDYCPVVDRIILYLFPPIIIK